MIYHGKRYSMEVDIQKGLRQWAYNMLVKAGFENVTLDRALYQYCNMLLRVLAPKPRKIEVSKEFFCPAECQEAYDYFCDAVEKGNNLLPFMSRTILDAEFKDKMIFDWGLYHFHLSKEPLADDPRFRERSGFLLIAYVDANHDETIYFLQIRPHVSSVWTEQELVKILADNWPELMERYRIKGAVSFTENVTDEIYKKARKNNVCTLVDLRDGRVYLGANLGLNSAGTSSWAVMHHNYICNDAALFEKEMGKHADFIGDVISKKLINPVSRFCLELVQPGNKDYLFKVSGHDFLLRFFL